MNELLQGTLTALAGGAAIKGMDYLFSISKTRSDRSTSRETNADTATKTALEALEKALERLQGQVDAEAGRRGTAEENVAVLKAAVDALAGRIEEQELLLKYQAAEMAEARRVKGENVKLKGQVAGLKRQVAALSKRIEELEGTKEAVARILLVHPVSDPENEKETAQ